MKSGAGADPRPPILHFLHSPGAAGSSGSRPRLRPAAPGAEGSGFLRRPPRPSGPLPVARASSPPRRGPPNPEPPPPPGPPETRSPCSGEGTSPRVRSLCSLGPRPERPGRRHLSGKETRSIIKHKVKERSKRGRKKGRTYGTNGKQTAIW